MSQAAKRPRISVGYAVEDDVAGAVARGLTTALERAGFEAVSAPEGSREGPDSAQGAFIVVSRGALRSRFVQNDVEAILGRTKENPAFPLLVLATSGVTPRDLAGGPLERLLDFQLISVDGPERLQADRLVETLTEALAGKSPRRPDVVRRRVVIHGRVQGVAFRDAMRRLAQEHEVSGWVQNNADGTVKAVFEGEPEAVERLVAFAHEGPPGARVDDVEVSEQDPEGLGGFDLTSERPREPEHDTPAPGDRVEWIPDSADSISRQDLLKRRPLARALAVRLHRIRKEEPDASFLIHFDGPWGSGKSTLLDFLAEELEGPGDDSWLVIRYDAWRQTRVGPPWWTLLVHLRQALASELPLRLRLSLRLAEMRFLGLGARRADARAGSEEPSELQSTSFPGTRSSSGQFSAPAGPGSASTCPSSRRRSS